jgi:hypothetical protein
VALPQIGLPPVWRADWYVSCACVALAPIGVQSSQ